MKDLLGEIKIFGLGINLRFKLVHKKWFSLKRPCQKVKYKRKNKFEMISTFNFVYFAFF